MSEMTREHQIATNLACTYCTVCHLVDPVEGEPCGGDAQSYADLTAKLHAAEQRWHDAVTHDGTLDELAALREKLAFYDRWLQGGVYFTTQEFQAHCEQHRQQLAAVQEEAKDLREACEAMAVKKVNGYDPEELLNEIKPLLEKHGAWQNLYSLNVLLEARKLAQQALTPKETP